MTIVLFISKIVEIQNIICHYVVSATNGTVTTASGLTHFLNGANIYAPHTEPSTYLFHGSISTYRNNFGTNSRLESGDLVAINFKIDSSRAGGIVSVSCLVP